MAVRCVVRAGAYFDSVVLMRIASELTERPDIRGASLVMATPANKEMLADAGLWTQEAGRAGPNDLIIAIDADGDVLDEAIGGADAALGRRTSSMSSNGHDVLRARAIAQAPHAELALISTPGRYAAAEARKALRLGMSVFLFSDNVALEDERSLKREAHERGLLVMGPDCGTAIVGGIPLGFANEVCAGDIALVGASGAGLQQVSTLIDGWGGGISHLIGVGGRDLSAEVGGISTLDALDALAGDSGTRVIVLVSKPPDPVVAAAVLDRAASTGKPVIAALLGADQPAPDGVRLVGTLWEAAAAAVRAAGIASPVLRDEQVPLAATGHRHLLRALYSGGTFAHETCVLLAPELASIAETVPGGTPGRGLELPPEHLVLDLGDDRFTVGRPHPMIDPTVRTEFLRAAGDDPRTAVIVLDVVLGHGAAPDPAGDLAPAIVEVTAREDPPEVIAFVVGTAADPQGLELQEQTLRDAGARVASSSSAAARLAGAMVRTEVAA